MEVVKLQIVIYTINMEYINNIIEYYDELFSVSMPQKKLYEDLTKSYMPAKLLRVGCGTGALEHWLSKNGHDVTGIETNQDMIETANRRRRLPNMALRFFQMSSLEMTRFLGKGFYNVISCLNDELIFRNDRILIRKLFYDCKTLLAENGVFLIQLTNFAKYQINEKTVLPIRESIRTKLNSLAYERDGKYFLSQSLEHYGKKPIPVLKDAEFLPIGKEDIESFAKEAGFTDIQFYGDWDLSPLTEKSDNILAMLR